MAAAGSVTRESAMFQESRSMSRPPVFDLGLLCMAVVRSLPWAIGLGVVIGLVAGGIASGFTSVYSVTTTVSVGTPARAERDAATMEALAAGMSEYVTDVRAQFFIEDKTGEPVSMYGLQPTLAVTTSKIPGLLEVVTRSSSGPLAASSMGTAAVEAMNLRAEESREEALAGVAEAAQEEIDLLNEQIAARRKLDSSADTSDLLQLIYDARSGTEQLRTAYPIASIVAQDDGGGAATWPKPVATGLVAGIATMLIAVLVLAVVRIRRSRRTDSIWARAAGHRHGAVVDVDTARTPALPPLTEAAVSAVLSAGGTVVVLGETEELDVPLGADAAEYCLATANFDDPWWREVPASDVGLGVVVVDLKSPLADRAEAGLATFSEVGVPARIAVRAPESQS